LADAQEKSLADGEVKRLHASHKRASSSSSTAQRPSKKSKVEGKVGLTCI